MTITITNLIETFGAEGTLIRLIAEMEAATNLLPTDTITESSAAMFDAILPLLDKAASKAGAWDDEVRRHGFRAGRLPVGAHLV